jgi:CheY-like chemotaxis protein
MGLAMTTTTGLHILHVDDVPMNLETMDQLLRAIGHVPIGASSSAEACARLQAQRFDVVLTDYHMPDMTGLDLPQAVRTMSGPARKTPVVIVTADVMSFDAAGLRDFGFASAVSKPISAEALRGAIAVAVDGGSAFVGEGFARRRL